MLKISLRFEVVYGLKKAIKSTAPYFIEYTTKLGTFGNGYCRENHSPYTIDLPLFQQLSIEKKAQVWKLGLSKSNANDIAFNSTRYL